MKEPIPDGFAESIGKRMNIAMVERGVSAKALARDSGLCYSTIAAIRRGARIPSAWAVVRICAALRCDAGWLLGMKGRR